MQTEPDAGACIERIGVEGKRHAEAAVLGAELSIVAVGVCRMGACDRRLRRGETVLVSDDDVPLAGGLGSELEGDARQLGTAVDALEELHVRPHDLVGDAVAALFGVKGAHGLARASVVADVTHVQRLVQTVAFGGLDLLDGVGAQRHRETSVAQLVEIGAADLVGQLRLLAGCVDMHEAPLGVFEREGTRIIGAYHPAGSRCALGYGIGGGALHIVVVDAIVRIAQGSTALGCRIAGLGVLLLEEDVDGVQPGRIEDGIAAHARHLARRDGNRVNGRVGAVALEGSLRLLHPVGAERHLIETSVAVAVLVKCRG